MFILNIIELILLLIVLPMGVGLLVLNFFFEPYEIMKGSIIYGYAGVFALLELVGIPAVLFLTYNGYTVLLIAFTALLVICGVCGWIMEIHRSKTVRLRDEAKSMLLAFTDLKPLFRAFAVIILVLIAFQIFMSIYYSSLDVDDYFYNAMATSAQSFKTLYRIDAGTGRSAPVDVRHGMALFPIWEAALSSLTGIHLLIIVHRIVPVVLIPLSYYSYYLISGELFPGKEGSEKRCVFMLLINIWRLFGNVSLFTTETFFYTRTWQGKSFAGNLLFPFAVYLLLRLFRKVYESNYEIERLTLAKSTYLTLGLFLLASGASSSLAVLLMIMLIGVASTVLSVARKTFKPVMYAVASCIPGFIYILIYVML